MKRWWAQLFAAGIASLVLPVILALISIVGESWQSGVGPLDDAPERAGTLLLILMPLALAAAVLYFAGSLTMLRVRGGATLRRLLLVNLMSSLGVGLCFALVSLGRFGWRDALLSFSLGAGFTMASLTCGALAWWGVARRTGTLGVIAIACLCLGCGPRPILDRHWPDAYWHHGPYVLIAIDTDSQMELSFESRRHSLVSLVGPTVFAVGTNARFVVA